MSRHPLGFKQPCRQVPFKMEPGSRLPITAICFNPEAIGHVQVSLSLMQKIRLFISRIAQSFRLMVGVHDYQAYVLHMQLKHPEKPPMTEKEFHRYCLEARYPSKAGKLGKCPC